MPRDSNLNRLIVFLFDANLTDLQQNCDTLLHELCFTNGSVLQLGFQDLFQRGTLLHLFECALSIHRYNILTKDTLVYLKLKHII